MANSIDETPKSSTRAGCETKSQSAYAFRFVEVGEPSKCRDQDARSLIRSHVMHDFYERRDNRRRPSTLPEKTSAASKKEGAAQQTHRFKVGPQGLTEIKKRRRKHDATVQREKSILPPPTSFQGPKYPVHSNAANSIVQVLRPPNSVSHLSYMQSKYQTNSTSGSQEQAPEPDIPEYSSDQPADIDLHKYLQPESLPKGSGIDPFNTLPPSRSTRTQVLLYHGKHFVFLPGDPDLLFTPVILSP
ncbi:hypothetical protein VTL71DRAFT_8586 [Oculimacula yallundae]|uniref:Uncharacterized protein n=1 Tax=Oculimacula yallundae TaxID=86028 RepID=A0ABR4CZ08_9HELO